jgi:hypothetical protein
VTVTESAKVVLSGTPEEVSAQLREVFGPPIWLRTALELHLLCAKREKDKPTEPVHGVIFRRLNDDDAVVYATNNRSAVRLLLPNDASLVPELGAVVPAKAMKLIAAAEDENAAFWFADGRVRIAVDGEIHEFRLLKVDALDCEPVFLGATGSVLRTTGFAVPADQLASIQKAMACEWVALRQPRKGVVAVLPDGNADGLLVGVQTLVTSLEDEG